MLRMTRHTANKKDSLGEIESNVLPIDIMSYLPPTLWLKCHINTLYTCMLQAYFLAQRSGKRAFCWPCVRVCVCVLFTTCSSIHDHTDSHCFMKLLQGQLKETLFDWPEGKSHGDMEQRSQRVLQENKCAYINGEETFILKHYTLIPRTNWLHAIVTDVTQRGLCLCASGRSDVFLGPNLRRCKIKPAATWLKWKCRFPSEVEAGGYSVS